MIWSTPNEIEFITYLASDEKRPGKEVKQTIEERKYKLLTWLARSYDRKWDDSVNVDLCREYASNLYGSLEQIKEEQSNGH